MTPFSPLLPSVTALRRRQNCCGFSGRASLASLPSRGHYPPELARLHISEFREIHVSIYRMVYQTEESERCVYIHALQDARRHVDELLRERLLREEASLE